MGLFFKLFGNKKEHSESNIIYAEQDARMKDATKYAQENFRYFWRELYWEYRRIVPAHGFAMIKIPFQQTVNGKAEPICEHMWIDSIEFNGDVIKGILINEPNQLTNITKGDLVTRTVSEISDWLIEIQGKTYGGFTIQSLRAGMSEKERKDHDSAWGLDFGDYNEVLLVYKQKENPENLIEHPMSKNTAEDFRNLFRENPDELSAIDEDGLTYLHREAIAGNITGIEILLELGADKNKKSNSNKTALDYAKLLHWEHLEELLN